MHPEKHTKNKAKEYFNLFLSKKGLKGTLQRDLIIDAFLDLDSPIDIDGLYLILRARHPGIGHATVYRALRLLAESGIAREIHFGDGVTRYQQTALGKRRDYLMCSDCGTVTEFENSSVEDCQVQTAKKLGFQLNSLKIELKGICSRCLSDASAHSKL